MEIGIPADCVDDTGGLVGLVEAAGGTPVVRAGVLAVDRADPDVIVLRGDRSVGRAIRTGCTSPIVPIDTRTSLEPIPLQEAAAAIDALVGGHGQSIERRAVGGSIDGGEAIVGVFELTMLTRDPATISEYVIRSAGRRVARYRADGIVIATPHGSSGYARSSGGAVVASDVDALSVVPISAYRTADDHWVLPSVSVTVARDETPVDVFADDQTVGEVAFEETLEVRPGRSFETIRLPQSRSPFDNGA